MARPIPPEIQRLIDRYKKAQEKLTELIATMQARGNTTAYRLRILAGVDEELRLLNMYAGKWAGEVIPQWYDGGIDRAYRKFRSLDIDVSKVAANARVVRLLVENAAGQLTDAASFVGRRIRDDIRKAGLDAVAQKTATGSTVKETKEALRDRLADDGLPAIRDKRGREISLDAYASTVARTTTREATNKGLMQEVTDNGYDLVKMTSHFSSCPICAQYEGRVYSVSGKDKRYPALSEIPGFGNGYGTIHPNCSHVLTPYIREYDQEAEAVQRQSNRAFAIDHKKKQSIDAYNARQQRLAARRRDRAEWLAAIAAAPTQAPKTLSAYRAMKRADSPTYRALKDRLAQ